MTGSWTGARSYIGGSVSVTKRVAHVSVISVKFAARTGGNTRAKSGRNFSRGLHNANAAKAKASRTRTIATGCIAIDAITSPSTSRAHARVNPQAGQAVSKCCRDRHDGGKSSLAKYGAAASKPAAPTSGSARSPAAIISPTLRVHRRARPSRCR